MRGAHSADGDRDMGNNMYSELTCKVERMKGFFKYDRYYTINIRNKNLSEIKKLVNEAYRDNSITESQYNVINETIKSAEIMSIQKADISKLYVGDTVRIKSLHMYFYNESLYQYCGTEQIIESIQPYRGLTRYTLEDIDYYFGEEDFEKVI
jgi:hypothetical protein